MNAAAVLEHAASLERIAAALRAGVGAEEAVAARPAPAPAAAAPAGLQKPAEFFAVLRDSKVLGPELTQGEVEGCNAILEACAGAYPLSWTAYALATSFHETAGTMQPVKEYGGADYHRRMYDIEGARPHKARELGNTTPGDGSRYCGRGYVQLTGKDNYARAERELGQPLVAKPDLAMQPDIAAQILVRGLKEGWFSGKSLNVYIPAKAEKRHFVAARRTVNGLDRAEAIADYALVFQRALEAGDWR